MNNSSGMHRFDRKGKRLSWKIMSYALRRIRKDPVLDHPRSEHELRMLVGDTVTPRGIGGDRALELWRNVLAPACISVDHQRFFAFVPGAPTEAAGLFDVAISAANVYAGSWLEGSGAVFAENQALRWLADEAGFPPRAGGVFVSGGTAGNLSALIAARWRWRHRANGVHDRERALIMASRAAHSSISQAAHAMDADIVWVDVDERGRMTGEATRTCIETLGNERERVCVIVATGGTTNVGVVDDLRGVGECARELNVWFHVDAAYGGAALIAPTTRHLFDGIDIADSMIVDPHKWLFAPFDCCALLYADPRTAKAAHTQRAEYLDVLHNEGDEWNPSDYAHHLSRRARGLPFWFSLATYGTDAYRDAVEVTLDVARRGAQVIDDAPHTELVMQPELSILVFRRIGWTSAQYQQWSDRVLDDGLAFVVPTTWRGETVLRLCIVNPLSTVDDIVRVVDSLS